MTQMTLITGAERRRRWSFDERERILAAASAPGAVVAEVGRRWDVCTKALSKLNIKDNLEKVSCLEGGSETRTVCTYKLGDFMNVMIISVKGSRDDLATV